ncbi:hypothetical protein RN001_001091 [Aquatica leii]|uniref:RecQ-mediated genome instability protein 1 n=1 Tax=Aquatica leii TaxID=1421715 RepID=A0AAN7SSK4_9COLE|nr:hypothetical protein RN001_001091 [Aquatica leii]
MDEIASTKNFFKTQNITLSDYWLESCIQWLHEENPNMNYNLETLHSTVYAQWLLLDLRDVEIPILPPNIAQQKKYMLNNTFCLQLLHIKDISQPKYQQLQKIRNSSLLINASINQEFKPIVTPKRMLQMLLTDGVQEVEAIEFKPIQILNVNMKPGTKIRIKGPVVVRRGQIFLEANHITILGGEIEELLVANAYENILARALKLPENPKPNLVEEIVESIMEEVAPIRHTRNTIDQFLTVRNLDTTNLTLTNKNNMEKKLKPNVTKEHIDDFDETLITHEIDMLLEAERDVADKIKLTEYNSDDDYMFLEAEKNILKQDTAKPVASHSNHVSVSVQDANDSMFEDMDIDAHLDIIDRQRSPPSINEITPIKNLLNNNNVACRYFTINAKFKKVVQKLTVTEDSWVLKVLLSDDSGDLEVIVDTKVISHLIGYAPSAVISLRKDVLNKDQCATTTFIKIISALKEKLMKINGKLVVNYTSKNDTPTLTEIL